MSKSNATNVRHKRRSNYVSLVTRAGLVMSVIVALALVSLMASMFVSDSLDGDAAQINISGSLRMQSIRLSRALIAEQNSLPIIKIGTVEYEVMQFESRLNQLEPRLGQQLQIKEVSELYSSLSTRWLQIKNIINENPEQFRHDHSLIDQFVETINNLVLALQKRSEVKIRILRIIQSVSVFLILLTAFIALLRINKSIVQPMNNLVRAATEAGKGNFSIKTDSKANTEIGLLARTFNDMSERLQTMHDNFEHRVQQKTSSLEQRNKSLELLYQTSHNLVKPKQDGGYQRLIRQIEDVLGHGELLLCMRDEPKSSSSAKYHYPISNATLPLSCQTANADCEQCIALNSADHTFSIRKNDDEYGFLRYKADKNTSIERWQTWLLKTIADNIAISINIENERSQQALIGLQEERAIIARELHDSLAQSLSYLKVQTSVLSKQLNRDSPRTRIDETIKDIRDGLSGAYRQLRELLTTFRLQVSDPSLESALKATAIEFTHKCRHPVKLELQLSPETLSPNEQIHILQIVREALSNIQRHAQANMGVITVKQSAEKTYVCVSDNGKGISDQPATRAQYGMSIMNERADSLGACLKIEPGNNGGTKVSLEFVSNANRAKPKRRAEQSPLKELS